MIHEVVARRFGSPSVVETIDFIEHRWNEHEPDRKCVLLMDDLRPELARSAFAPEIADVYGHVVGGFLVGTSMKIATLTSKKVYGLYRIGDLQELPIVRYAAHLDPEIHFFMDSANVWYYGVKAGHLFCFDRATSELDDLGDFAVAMEELMGSWEEAGQ